VKPKSTQIREKSAAGDHIGALRAAAHFHDRSNATKTFKRGMTLTIIAASTAKSAKTQMNLFAAAITLLQSRFR
jgi:hypothetical protein